MDNSIAHKTLKSASTQTIVTIITMVLTLMVFSILSRLLTKEDFGYFAVITAITAIFNVITEAGMGSAVIQVHKINKQYFDTAFNLALLFGVVFSIILYFLSIPISKAVADVSISVPLKWMSISVLFCSLNSVVKANMTRKLDFKNIGIYNIIAYLIASSFAVFTAYIGWGVYSVILQTVLNSFFTFVVFYWKLEDKPQWFVLSKKYVKNIFSFGGWLTASVLLRVIYQQLDKLLMSIWVSVSTIGAYNRPAGFISHTSTSLNGIIDTILFPILSSIQNDRDKIRRALGKIIYLINLYSSILCILFIVSTKTILTVFFGSEWLSLSVVFIVLSSSLLVGINSRVMDCFIRSLAFVKMGFLLRIIACVITLAFLYIGKDYGLIGIALAVVLSDYVITLIKLMYIGYEIKYSFWSILKNMLNAQKIIIIPLSLILLFYKYINYSVFSSILSLVIMLVYFGFVLFCVKGMMGDDLSNVIYKKFPFFKKLLIVK